MLLQACNLRMDRGILVCAFVLEMHATSKLCRKLGATFL